MKPMKAHCRSRDVKLTTNSERTASMIVEEQEVKPTSEEVGEPGTVH